MTEQWQTPGQGQTPQQPQPAPQQFQQAPQQAQPAQPAPQQFQQAPQQAQPAQPAPQQFQQAQPAQQELPPWYAQPVQQPPKKDFKDNFLWIILATIGLYVFLSEIIAEIIFGTTLNQIGWKLSPSVRFVVQFYLITIVSFIFVFVYTRLSRKNRPVFDTFLLGYENNSISSLMWGTLVGFIMNGACILAAFLHGDIKLYLSFAVGQIPFYIFALICVWIQSSSEELWCRGFMYERLLYRYPLWVAILVNGVFFALLHVFNPGADVLPIVDIAICGLSFSLAKWYTKSIWFPMGIHTGWNFTQNFLFGLPNSGLVPETSVFTLDAANARTTWVYDVAFGVEGAWPAVLADLLLGVVILILAYRNGRIKELFEKKGQSAE